MAKTYTAIQTIVCSGGETSVTFNNIPQNYTDLKLVGSHRSNAAGSIYSTTYVYFNGDNTSSNYASKMLDGAGSGTPTSYANYLYWAGQGATSTSNTFANSEMYILAYSTTNRKVVSIDNVMETNATGAYVDIGGGIWSGTNGTSPITSIYIYNNGSSYLQYSTFTLYGIGQGAKASGGTVVGSGNYIYHTFTSTGTFTPTEQIKNAEVLAVAGGGGGGGDQAGGGGAGGVLYQSGVNFTAGTPYVTSVGAGGAGASVAAAIGSQGSNSFVANVTAIGGGYGAYTSSTTGGNGGSGGGASQSTGTAGTGTAGQGNNGGSTTINTTGAGGGGAGGIGSSATSAPGGANGGNGGPGTSTYQAWHYATQTGVNVSGVYYIGGGGGGGGHSTTSTLNAGGTGGVGGGGNGGNYSNNSAARTVPTAGTANTGGGGGGEGWFGVAGDAKAGGSGLVIIRYQLA